MTWRDDTKLFEQIMYRVCWILMGLLRAMQFCRSDLSLPA
jgi:hypothetical protein